MLRLYPAGNYVLMVLHNFQCFSVYIHIGRLDGGSGFAKHKYQGKKTIKQTLVLDVNKTLSLNVFSDLVELDDIDVLDKKQN